MGEVEKYSYTGRTVRERYSQYHHNSNMLRDGEYMESLVSEVVKNVNGRRITVEGEDDEEVILSE